jgi:hypothetical protein
MLEVKVPSVAEMFDLENKTEAALEAKWKAKVENMARDENENRKRRICHFTPLLLTFLMEVYLLLIFAMI